MQSSLALNVPQSGPTRSPYYVAWVDIIAGVMAFGAFAWFSYHP